MIHNVQSIPSHKNFRAKTTGRAYNEKSKRASMDWIVGKFRNMASKPFYILRRDLWHTARKSQCLDMRCWGRIVNVVTAGLDESRLDHLFQSGNGKASAVEDREVLETCCARPRFLTRERFASECRHRIKDLIAKTRTVVDDEFFGDAVCEEFDNVFAHVDIFE
jgi:hypothetical protein